MKLLWLGYLVYSVGNCVTKCASRRVAVGLGSTKYLDLESLVTIPRWNITYVSRIRLGSDRMLDQAIPSSHFLWAGFLSAGQVTADQTGPMSLVLRAYNKTIA